MRSSYSVPLWQTAEASAQVALPKGLKALFNPVVLGLVAVVVLALAWIKKILDTPSRKYTPENPNVGAEYDAWTLYASSSQPWTHQRVLLYTIGAGIANYCMMHASCVQSNTQDLAGSAPVLCYGVAYTLGTGNWHHHEMQFSEDVMISE